MAGEPLSRLGVPSAASRSGRRWALRGALGITVGLGLVVVGVSSASASGAPSPGRTAGGGHPAASVQSPLGDLTTYGYGNSRTNDDTINPAVTSVSVHPAWNKTLDGAVYGQPLVYGTSVYVGTESDTVYALGARKGTVLWRVQTGRAVPLSVVDSAPTLSSGCGDIDPLGITGTPVIDPPLHEIFFAEETEAGGATWRHVQHWLVALSLRTHRELWHRRVDPPHPNSASTYYVAAEQQRPALTLWKGRVYIEYGGLDGDCGQYHGYVVSLPATGRGALRSYRVPTQREGGIWGVSGAFVSAAGDLYVNTGNGSSNSLRDFDEGNSVIELSPSLRRLGYWAPRNWVTLNDDDWDLGSTGPVPVPGTSLLFATGKPDGSGSQGYLMAVRPLRGIGRGAYTGAVCPGGGSWGGLATAVVGSGTAAKTYVFAPCTNGTEALLVRSKAPISFHRVWGASTGSPSGSPLVSGRMVWAVNYNSGGLFGMSIATGKVVVERSTDSLPHFATPAIGDKMLVIPTSSGVEAFSAR